MYDMYAKMLCVYFHYTLIHMYSMIDCHICMYDVHVFNAEEYNICSSYTHTLLFNEDKVIIAKKIGIERAAVLLGLKWLILNQ